LVAIFGFLYAHGTSPDKRTAAGCLHRVHDQVVSCARAGGLHGSPTPSWTYVLVVVAILGALGAGVMTDRSWRQMDSTAR